MAATGVEKEAAKTEAEIEVQRLRSELDALKTNFETRISAMEALLAKAGASAAEEEISAETLAIIAGAVTAYLGKKVRIRSARFVPTATQWKQAGRVSVQAGNTNR